MKRGRTRHAPPEVLGARGVVSAVAVQRLPTVVGPPRISSMKKAPEIPELDRHKGENLMVTPAGIEPALPA